MASINNTRVILGGLAAGLVMNVIDFISNMFIMGARTQAEWTAVNPLIWANANDPKKLPAFLLIDFALGILLVWLYAALRPQFGPGPATAVRAAIFAWLVGGSVWYLFTLLGLFSYTSFVMGNSIALVNTIASAMVGAKLYKEAA